MSHYKLLGVDTQGNDLANTTARPRGTAHRASPSGALCTHLHIEKQGWGRLGPRGSGPSHTLPAKRGHWKDCTIVVGGRAEQNRSSLYPAPHLKAHICKMTHWDEEVQTVALKSQNLRVRRGFEGTYFSLPKLFTFPTTLVPRNLHFKDQ